MRRSAVVVFAVAVTIVVAACDRTPPPLKQESADTWRGFLNGSARLPRLGAAMLLARDGDASGSSVLLAEMPRLSNHEKQVAVDVLSATTQPASLEPALVDDLIRTPDFCAFDGIRLVASGTETRHVDALTSAFATTLQSDGQKALAAEGRLVEIATMLARTGDLKAMQACEAELARSRLTRGMSPSVVARIRSTLMPPTSDAASTSPFEEISRHYNGPELLKLQGSLISRLGTEHKTSALVNLWLSKLPDETTASAGTDVPWDTLLTLFDLQMESGSLRTTLARQIGMNWESMSAAEKNRLSAQDRDRLLLASARFGERTGAKQMSRETFLRELDAPYGQLVFGIMSRQSAGDKDLKALLTKKALATTDAQQARDCYYGLIYCTGTEGPPPEVEKRMQELASSPSPTQPTTGPRVFNQLTMQADQKRQIKELAGWKNRPTPRPTSTPNAPYAELTTRWQSRRHDTSQALADLREIRQGLESYCIDNSSFPPRLQNLTTPIQYLKAVKPDVCAPSGPYGYHSQRSLPGYGISSTGSDGSCDVPLELFMVTMALRGTLQDKNMPYVRVESGDFQFSAQPTGSGDIVQTRW